MAKHIFDGARTPKHSTQSNKTPQSIETRRHNTIKKQAQATIKAAKQAPNNKAILSDLQRLIQTETAKLQATSETTSGTLGEIESKHLSRLASAAAVLASADKKLNDNSALERLEDSELEALALEALQDKPQ